MTACPGTGMRRVRSALLAAACLSLAGCQPPAETAQAAGLTQFAPLVMTAPGIRPSLTVLPYPGPGSLPAPVIHPSVMLLAAAELEAEEANPTAPARSSQSQDVGASSGGSSEGAVADAVADAVSEESAAAGDSPMPKDFEMLGERVAPGTVARLTWTPTETFTGNTAPSAVLVAHGTQPGPTLCLTAAVHGDELNGIETVRRVLHEVQPERLSGTVIGVPIVNLQGFHRNSRYLPDRRDLNRFFPGNPTGSAASRIAYSLFNNVIRHCTWLVDLHTGSFHRTNLPQLRADLNDQRVVELTQGFGSTVILHSGGAEGTLRQAATDAGIPAVTLEAGMPMQVQEDAVDHSVKGIFTLLDTIGLYDRRSLWGNPEPIYYQSRWVRADHGGILAGEVRLGRRVRRGDLLGTVIDPISNEQNAILSPFQGRVIGMALDQFVMPGYATFHIGIEADVGQAMEYADDEDIDHADEGLQTGYEEGD